MSGSGRGPAMRHLGDRLCGYADRSLPAPLLLECDRHLVACSSCRAAAEDERRVLLALRQAPTMGVSAALRASLLNLESLAPAFDRPEQLAVVSRGAPPRHRSAARAAMLAGLAAGASAAAACSLGMVGVGVAADAPAAPGIPARAVPTVAPASAPGVSAVTAVTPVVQALPAGPWQVVSAEHHPWARSTSMSDERRASR